MTLAWNPSTNADVTGYNIYYGTVSRAYTNKLFVGDVTNATITGLAEGTVYYFAATALNSTGVESPFSNEAVYAVPRPVVLSIRSALSGEVPRLLTVTAAGAVPTNWVLQSSPDLRTWKTIAQGTNSTVNVPVPAPGVPRQFFRLLDQ